MLKLKRSAMALSIIALSALSTTMIATSAHAYQCKGAMTKVVAVQKDQAVAHHQSIAMWKGKAKGDYGLPWSVWEIAKYKQVKCAPLGGGNFACQASAKACKYVVQ